MYYVHRVLLACSIVTLSACSTMTIESDHDASANFSNLKTYAMGVTRKAGSNLDKNQQ